MIEMCLTASELLLFLGKEANMLNTRTGWKGALAALLTLSVAPAWAGPDEREDRWDKREDVRDAQHEGGWRDKAEDKRDAREDVRDAKREGGEKGRCCDREGFKRFLENHPRIRKELKERYGNLSDEQKKDLYNRFCERHAKARATCSKKTPQEKRAWLKERCDDRRKRCEEFRKNHPGWDKDGCGGPKDRLEDCRDRREDVRDHREDHWDEKHDGGPRDRIEDRKDQREDVRDRKEDKRDDCHKGNGHKDDKDHPKPEGKPGGKNGK
jgi:hypothetical protein